MISWLYGTGVALITPFDANRQVDFAALDRVVEHLIAGGAGYLVALGTTGETATLSPEEQEAVLQQVVATNRNRLPLVIGVGGNHTLAVVEKLKAWEARYQPAGFLSVSPYYNKPSQEGIYQHYKAIAEASSSPVILYNVPGRTASNMLANTTLRLAEDFQNIVAMKEASGNLEQCMTILANKPDGFALISGDDALTLPLLALGATGIISVAANAFPAPFCDMVRLGLEGNFEEARRLHFQLFELMGLLFSEGNPVGVKALMAELGLCGPEVRLPLVEASPALKASLAAAWGKAGN